MKKVLALIGALTVSSMAFAGPPKPVSVRQGLIWKDTINITVSDCATENNKLGARAAVDRCLLDDGGSFTDDSTDFNDSGTTDVNPFPATPAVNDAFYLCDREQFEQVEFDIGTQGSTVMTVVWEYYDGSAWSTLTFTRQDVADFDEAAGTHFNHWDAPTDWATTTVSNFGLGYCVRARVSAYTSVTTQAALDQGWILPVASSPAKQIVIRSDTDETEDLWCDAGTDTAVDVGFVIDAGTGSLTVEVENNAQELTCCGDGGAVDINVMLMDEK